ncbi:hypothetical protein QR680_007487 [Steinernema hermaphroditum]|uniref:Uncharacterized protein n=1 Tax=Steinernema hermaphroditum TaxID=289476 RepID=A0AA39M6G8_9BILA|nr:hypothetical protein QR680_007487 [Steinernema hermaphroditum]
MFSGHYENLLQFNISFSVDMHRENGNDPSTVETFICELLRMNSEPPKKETSYEMRLKGSKLLAKKLDLTRGIFKKFGIYVQLMYSGKESQKAAVSRGSTALTYYKASIMMESRLENEAVAIPVTTLHSFHGQESRKFLSFRQWIRYFMMMRDHPTSFQWLWSHHELAEYFTIVTNSPIEKYEMHYYETNVAANLHKSICVPKTPRPRESQRRAVRSRTGTHQ